MMRYCQFDWKLTPLCGLRVQVTTDIYRDSQGQNSLLDGTVSMSLPSSLAHSELCLTLARCRRATLSTSSRLSCRRRRADSLGPCRAARAMAGYSSVSWVESSACSCCTSCSCGDRPPSRMDRRGKLWDRHIAVQHVPCIIRSFHLSIRPSAASEDGNFGLPSRAGLES